jgi:protein tyrosine phosphatase
MAPTGFLAEDFWRMIIENNVKLVVTLCPEVENGKV